MKTLATISAVLCITVVAAIAAPRSATPGYDYGLTGNDWWAAQTHRAAITMPSRPADFQYGLTGNDWWAGKSKAARPAR